MFGRRVKFVVAGDQPSPVQCGRCHELGHWANAPVCKIPKSAVRCYKCGGAHDSCAHSFHCKGTHKTAGICDCTPRCLLCKKPGHDARSRKCPQRGNFAPPRFAKQVEGEDQEPQTTPPAPPKGKGKARGGRKQHATDPTPTEPQNTLPTEGEEGEAPPLPLTDPPREPELTPTAPTLVPSTNAPGPSRSRPQARLVTSLNDDTRAGELYKD